MNYASLGISLVALLPAILLCIFVYTKDKSEKEPISLVLILFLSGAAVFFPSLYAEKFLSSSVDSLFADKMSFSFDGILSYSSEGDRFLHLMLTALVVAVTEEALKWFLLFFITRKNKNFNYLFDGIVYSTFVSMGFAAVENIRYALIDGWDTLFFRAVTSVPGHLFFGIFMGYCYTLWNTYRCAEKLEKDLISRGKASVSKFKHTYVWLILSFILPIIVHFIYTFTNIYDSSIVTAFFYIFVIVLYILCFININHMSDKDANNNRLAYSLVLKKHLNIESNIDKLLSNREAKGASTDE